MVEFEADDAIAAAAERFGADPRVERILICTPDKDMAQCVRDDRIVLWDRRRDTIYDEDGVRAKWGVGPSSVADRLALVGDAADGFPGLPGWGDKSASAVLARYGTLEAIPRQRRGLGRPGLCSPVGLAATLRDQMADALLFRDLARLRTTADGVGIPEQDVDELEWRGADRSTWEAFCDEWELAAAARPPAPLARGVARRTVSPSPAARTGGALGVV